MGNENYSDSLCAQIPHKAEKLLDFLIVKGRSRLVKNENLAVHVNGTRDCDHLLDGD